MQSDEIKQIRIALGWRQEEMADQLGLSRVFVGMMERDEKKIEPRTSLAVRQLYDASMRYYAGHRSTPLDDDVPIAKAQIIWDPDGDDDLPPVAVVGSRSEDDDRYSSSGGSCTSEWASAGPVGQLLLLLRLFVQLTVSEEIDPAAVHAAFSRIPEYRDALPSGLFEAGVGFPAEA